MVHMVHMGEGEGEAGREGEEGIARLEVRQEGQVA